MFKKLKQKLINKFLRRKVADLLHWFKVKPERWATIVFIAGILKYGVTLGETHYDLAWLLEVLDLAPAVAQTIEDVVTDITLAVLGASTTPFLTNSQRQDEHIKKSKKIIAESKS